MTGDELLRTRPRVTNSSLLGIRTDNRTRVFVYFNDEGYAFRLAHGILHTDAPYYARD